MVGSFVAVTWLRIANSVDAHGTVAADHPMILGVGKRSRLTFGQTARQDFPVTVMLSLDRVFVEIGRPRFESDPGLFQHQPANLAVTGQYQRHIAPGEKSVEKSLYRPSAKTGMTQCPGSAKIGPSGIRDSVHRGKGSSTGCE